jgi:hypothetical protein
MESYLILLLCFVSLCILLALLYIVCITRNSEFHHRNYALNVSFTITIVLCGIMWIVQNRLSSIHLNKTTSMLLFYFFFVTMAQIPMALLTLAIYRLVTIVYRSIAAFRRRTFVPFLITCQWVFCFVISVPLIVFEMRVGVTPLTALTIDHFFF